MPERVLRISFNVTKKVKYSAQYFKKPLFWEIVENFFNGIKISTFK